MNVNEVINFLEERGFERYCNDYRYPIYYSKFKNRYIILDDRVLVRNNRYREKINEQTREVRSYLREKKVNIWNVYYLLITTSSSFDATYYYIERDARNLRKYVILGKDDLLRIPFLNDSNDINNIDTIRNFTRDDVMENIKTKLVEKNGENIKFTNQGMRKFLNEIKFLEES